MKIYHWHPETKELIDVTDARVDPEEHRIVLERAIAMNPHARKVTVDVEHWLIPANSTPEAPPALESDKHVIRRIGDKWINELRPEFQPEAPDVAVARIVAEAKAALAETQLAVLEAYEHQNPVPKHVVAYRDALRDIIKANGEGVTELPAKPEV